MFVALDEVKTNTDEFMKKYLEDKPSEKIVVGEVYRNRKNTNLIPKSEAEKDKHLKPKEEYFIAVKVNENKEDSTEPTVEVMYSVDKALPQFVTVYPEMLVRIETPEEKPVEAVKLTEEKVVEEKPMPSSETVETVA